MPVFSRVVIVNIVRDVGTPAQQTLGGVEMGGNLRDEALFYTRDQVKKGDEIHCSIFDEPRVITAVHPEVLLDGRVSHWVTEIVPKSVLQSRTRGPFSINVSGQNARLNINSVDQSIQHFRNSPLDSAAILNVLNEIREALKQANVSESARKDALLDTKQAELELERTQPEPRRIWKAVEGLGVIAGVAEKLAKLAPLLGQIFPN